MKKKDDLVIGIVLGLLLPMAGVYIFYLWKAGSSQFSWFLNAMLQNKSLLTAAISFALVANAGAFTWCVNTNRYKTAKGIFIITLLITIPCLVYKIFY